jgi:hypothetical protein
MSICFVRFPPRGGEEWGDYRFSDYQYCITIKVLTRLCQYFYHFRCINLDVIFVE